MAKLYDAHCHMMNLSHPNLSLMVRRIMKEIGIVERIEVIFAGLLFGLFGKTARKLTKVDDRLLNLLAIMETEMGDFILQMEKDHLCSCNPERFLFVG